jgi:uncharacterized membrane protein
VKEANAFISSEQFDQAINTAKYVMSNLDKDSTDAKSIIETAKMELKKMTEKKAEEMKGELQNKLGF